MKNVNSYKNSKGEIWLNVASSIYVLPDFVNLDNHIFLLLRGILPALKAILPSKYHGWMNSYIEATGKAVMLKHDCRNKLEFPDNSVDHILCSHFLEHVYPQETKFILNDFLRVLKPGGTLHVIVPDIENNINNYLKQKEEGNEKAADNFILDTLLSKDDRGSLKYRLMEFHGGFGLQHRWMYDNASMNMMVKSIGFEIMKGNETPSKEFRANDDSVHVVCKKI
jgi:predicted SAM-dependent methyltransferase